MIHPNIVAEVRRLLAKGHSHREIARRLPVCRGSVANIASGRRRDRLTKYVEEIRGWPPERCPGCGGIVQMPCRACQIRAMLAHTGPHAPAEDDAGLGLELKFRNGEHERYLEIRRRREAEEEEGEKREERCVAARERDEGVDMDWQEPEFDQGDFPISEDDVLVAFEAA